jgi:hypothetical protein
VRGSFKHTYEHSCSIKDYAEFTEYLSHYQLLKEEYYMYLFYVRRDGQRREYVRGENTVSTCLYHVNVKGQSSGKCER